jgi:transcriptional regulator with XRE-family HTH domain
VHGRGRDDWKSPRYGQHEVAAVYGGWNLAKSEISDRYGPVPRLSTVDDARIGGTYRLLRTRKGWTQAELAAASGCSKSEVSQIERGQIGSVSLDRLREVARPLEMRLALTPRWRGADLGRLLDSRHAAMAEAVARHISEVGGWTLAPEVTYSEFGERGVIDLLAWHAARRMLLIVELKTVLVEIQELLASMDRRRRLAPKIAAQRGWDPASISSLVLVQAGRTADRRVAEHRAVLRAAFPDDGRALAGWLRDPDRPISMLARWHERSG